MDGEQQEIGQCRECGCNITGRNRQALYCSNACRRRYRDKTRNRTPAYWARKTARALKRRKERYWGDPAFRSRQSEYAREHYDSEYHRRSYREQHAIEIVDRNRKRTARKLEQDIQRAHKAQQRLSAQRQCCECGRDFIGHFRALYCSNACSKCRNNRAERKRYNKWRREIYAQFNEDEKLLFNARKHMHEHSAAGIEKKRARHHRAETKRRSVVQALRELGWLADNHELESLMVYVSRIIVSQLDQLDDIRRASRRQRRVGDVVYREQHREKLRQYARERGRMQRRADPEGVREQARARYAKMKQDPGAIERARKYRRERRQAILERQRLWREQNPLRVQKYALNRKRDRSNDVREKERTIIRAMRELGWLQGYDIQIPDEGLKR